MRRVSNILLAVLVAAVAAGSCKSQYDALLASSDVDAKYKAAFEFYNTGKYAKAAALFESMSVYVSGTAQEDTVLYYWGLSNYKQKDFLSADANFQKFVSTFPRSPFTQEARFLRLDCLYRQTLRYELDAKPTYTCLSAIEEYKVDYPDDAEHKGAIQAMLKDLNERLDRKSYEAAKLYYKMEDYLASRVAFRNILKTDADNVYREDILYYIAMSSYKYAQLSVPAKQRERYMTFMDDYFNFVGEIETSPYRKELSSLYARAQKAVGNYSGAPDDLDATSEKEFAKEREAAIKEREQAQKAEKEAMLQAQRQSKEDRKAEKEAQRKLAKELNATHKAERAAQQEELRKRREAAKAADKAERQARKEQKALEKKARKAGLK